MEDIDFKQYIKKLYKRNRKRSQTKNETNNQLVIVESVDLSTENKFCRVKPYIRYITKWMLRLLGLLGIVTGLLLLFSLVSSPVLALEDNLNKNTNKNSVIKFIKNSAWYVVPTTISLGVILYFQQKYEEEHENLRNVLKLCQSTKNICTEKLLMCGNENKLMNKALDSCNAFLATPLSIWLTECINLDYQLQDQGQTGIFIGSIMKELINFTTDTNNQIDKKLLNSIVCTIVEDLEVHKQYYK